MLDSCETKKTCMNRYRYSDINNLEKNLWFMSKLNSNLFYILDTPITKEIYDSVSNKQITLNFENFVGVKNFTKLEQGKLPSNVRLRIGYTQGNDNNKKIINAGIYFSGFKNVLEFIEGNTTSVENLTEDSKIFYEYELIIEWIPLTHTELTIEFALTWKLYLLLYVAIGVIALVMVSIFCFLHFLTSRQKKKYFKFIFFLKRVWFKAFGGLFFVLLCKKITQRLYDILHLNWILLFLQNNERFPQTICKFRNQICSI